MAKVDPTLWVLVMMTERPLFSWQRSIVKKAPFFVFTRSVVPKMAINIQGGRMVTLFFFAPLLEIILVSILIV